MKVNWKFMLGAAALVTLPAASFADSIDPTMYEDTLTIGESVTIRKTVTVDDRPPTTAPIDVMFVFDHTGSMSGPIAAAKAAATDIMTGLAGFGTLRTGTGWYDEAGLSPIDNPTGHKGVSVDLNSGNTGAASGIDNMFNNPGSPIGDNCPFGDISCHALDGFTGGGGDGPEQGYAGIRDAALGASWAPGSARFIVVLGDAVFKDGPDGMDNEAGAIAAAIAAGATIIGADFGGGPGMGTFVESMTPLAAATGGSIFDGNDAAGITAGIIAAVGSSFETYTEVTVDDLGGGLPGVGVSTACVSADIGMCVGADAVGRYDRSVTRTFEFDVTFTALEIGDWHFETFGLVDGVAVAREEDWIHVVPEPATLALLGLGLAGLGLRRRNKLG